ncbi:coatomer subunit delta [Sorochytrium milnesiophthora]
MVVLAATICSKNGKVIVSRQFLDMSRARIEGLMASFPKLISSGTQHTTIDTEEVRFVYQPLEALFLVLITSKRSNILQDIDTLHLFARVVAEHCHRSMDEKEVVEHAFELLNAFDEVVSMGYRENVNLAQIRTISEMDSNEERIQEMIAKNKEMEAKEQSRMKAKQLEMQRKMQKLAGGPGMGMGMGGGGFGSGGYGGNSYGGGSGGGAGSYIPPSTNAFGGPSRAGQTSPTRSSGAYSPSVGAQKTGMKLGAAKKGPDFGDVFGSPALAGGQQQQQQQQLETGMGGMSLQSGSASMAASAAGPSSPIVPTEAVHVIIEETISVLANRDGGLENMQVKGKLMLKLSDPDKAHIRVGVKTAETGGTNPSIDKKAFQSEGVLALKDASRPFQVGPVVDVLMWRLVSKDESAVPITINCWPSVSGDGHCDVNIEYELQNTSMELKNVTIAIPLPPSTSQPTISEIDGHYLYDRVHHTLLWQLPLIDASNGTGSLEFRAQGEDPGSFFPVSVNFMSNKPLCDVEARLPFFFGMVTPADNVTLQPDEYKFV